MTAILARALLPLDALRAFLLGLLGPWGRRFFAERSLRVACVAGFGVALALGLTCAAPLWAFALGPLILGVPHLAADIRYLVVLPRLHRRSALAFAAGVPIAVAAFTQNTAIGLASGLSVIVFAEASRSRKVLLFASWSCVVVAAALRPYVAALVLVHGHNFVAVALFFFAFARARRVGGAIAVGTIALSVALVLGAFDPVLFRGFAIASHPATGLSLDDMIAMLAPVTDRALGARLVFLFVFMQGVHYVVWLRLVPEEGRDRPGIRSFASSLRALDRDIGAILVALFALFAIVVLARAASSLEGARIMYLTAAGFHAHLEIAFTLLLALEGRRLLAPPAT